MVYVHQLPRDELAELLERRMPEFGNTPFAEAPDKGTARVALVTTAGIHRTDDHPFEVRESGYRIIPADSLAIGLAMSHQSAAFDRTGFQQDVNVVFPIDRLRELAWTGAIGSVARTHYSFMGAGGIEATASFVLEVAGMMKEEGVNAALLSPV